MNRIYSLNFSPAEAAATGDTKTPPAATGDGKTPAAGDTSGKGAEAGAAAKAEGDQVAKDAAAKAAADAAAGEKPPPAKKAPDKYELKLPEKTTLDDTDLKAVETIARENGWTNEEAQLALQQHHDHLIEQSNQFLEVTKADKTYGGEHLAKSQARAKAVIDRIRPASHPRAAAFKALLDKSGYGNNIEIVSFLADLGAQLDEDGGAGGDGTAGVETPGAAQVLYGGKK